MSILIISEPNDIHAHSIITALGKHKVNDVHSLDFSNFSALMSMNLALSARDSGKFWLQIGQNKLIDSTEISAVWWRRPQNYRQHLQSLEPLSRHFAMTEPASMLHGLWQDNHCLWVNNVVRDAAAAHRPWQLELAKQCGLRVPDTLLTTTADRVKQFWQRYRGEIVYKPLLQTFRSEYETQKMKPEEFAQIDKVQLEPILFQQWIRGTAYIRVTIVGTEILTAATDRNKNTPFYTTQSNSAHYQRHSLTAIMQDRLLLFMKQICLEYGVIDLCLRPDGEYVFLELHSAGEFLTVERTCQLPISDKLARHLARNNASKVPPVPVHKKAA